LHACLAEQALNAGDLATAADEVLQGLAALKGAALAEEEIRLLAAAARVGADLAALPGAARPGEVAASWEAASASLGGRARAISSEQGGRQPEVAAFGALAAAESARQHGHDNRATWRARLGGQASAPAAPAAASARFDLTGREADVLALLVKGDSNRQIARALFISDRTVAVHVSRILDKLGVRNRTEAATMGAHLGLTASAAPAASPGKEPDGHPNRR
jgi:DNA-binding CsgD family transcriptional regulator